MLDIGWQELFVIVIVLIIFIKPQDMPNVIVTVRDFIKKLRGVSREFHNVMDDIVAESNLKDIQRELEYEGNEMLGNMDFEMHDFDETVNHMMTPPAVKPAKKKTTAKKPAQKKAVAKKPANKKSTVKKAPAKTQKPSDKASSV